MTRIGTKQDVNRIVKVLSITGFSVDKKPEYIQAFDGDVAVYRAMKKDATVWVVWYNEEYFG